MTPTVAAAARKRYPLPISGRQPALRWPEAAEPPEAASALTSLHSAEFV